MKALVTGGGGFLGSEIIRQLLDKGVEVRSLQRGHYPDLQSLGIEIHSGDISDQQTCNHACKDCDVVFHVAAKAGVWGAYEGYYRPNVIGTKNIIAACLKNNIKYLVYTSSPSAVFDGHDEQGIDESTPYPTHFLSHYSATKAQAEQLILAANSDKLATVALRPHLIWGIGDPHLFPRIINRARTGKLRTIANKGKLVDITHVENAAYAHILAMTVLLNNAACAGKTYFISNDEPMTMADIINRFLAVAQMPPVTRTVSPAVAYTIGIVMETTYKLLGIKTEPFMTRFIAKQLSVAHWYDLSAAKRDLGYRPKISIEQGMQRLQQALADDDHSLEQGAG